MRINRYVIYYGNSNGVFSFEETGGKYTQVQDPDGDFGTTVVEGISGDTLFGYYFKSAIAYGFIDTDGLFATIEEPFIAGQNTKVLGVSGDTVVGIYGVGNTSYGFVESGGVFEPFADPLARPGVTLINGFSGTSVYGYYYPPGSSGELGFIADLSAVPEPSSIGLLTLGATALLIRRRPLNPEK